MASMYGGDLHRGPDRRNARYRESASATPVWAEVSWAHPCPVCGAGRGCDVITDGAYVRCAHAVSAWPMTGGGWLHRLARPAGPAAPARRPVPTGAR
jgi:hypothetical protein